jgi:hypothetical protein
MKSAESILEHYDQNIERWSRELLNFRNLVALEKEASKHNVPVNNRSLKKH